MLQWQCQVRYYFDKSIKYMKFIDKIEIFRKKQETRDSALQMIRVTSVNLLNNEKFGRQVEHECSRKMPDVDVLPKPSLKPA